MQVATTRRVGLDRTTASGEIFRQLRERIKQGELTPGTQLSENDFAQELGVSRTPVREAFIQLRQQGLLRILPQRGSFVAPINVDDVENSFFLRETLELRTVELAARRCGDAEAASLRAIVDRHRSLIEADDHAAFVAADDEMHRRLIEICGRPLIWTIVSDAKLQIDRLRYLTAQDTASRYRIVSDHERIVEAVTAKDAAAAVTAMRQHLGNIFSNIEELSASHPSYIERSAEVASAAGQ